MSKIFLSFQFPASDSPYYASFDRLATREAIIGLLPIAKVIQASITHVSHPAVDPMIEIAANSLDYQGIVVVPFDASFNSADAYTHGVFIGGGQELADQFFRFNIAFPDAKMLPVASTGGAAEVLYEEGSYNEALKTQGRYRQLFREVL